MTEHATTEHATTEHATNTLNRILDNEHVIAFDQKVDNAFALLRKNRFVSRMFYAISESANHSICWHVLTFLLMLFRIISPKRGIAIAIALGIESGFVNGPMKMMFRRQRPTMHEAHPHKLRVPLTSSFPSGHATSATCATILLTSGNRSIVRNTILAAFASLVASSRIYVRIHHASDVIAGAMVGGVLGILFRRFLPR